MSNMETYLLDITFNVTKQPITNDNKFKVKNMSSKGENCGLYCLKMMELLDDNYDDIRRNYSITQKRISGEELGRICAEQSTSLLIVQLTIDQNFRVDIMDNVLYTGAQFEYYVPNEVINSVVLLNDHGHFNLVLRNDDVIVLPLDIIELFKLLPGNNYQQMLNIFTEFDDPIHLTSFKLKSLYNIKQ